MALDFKGFGSFTDKQIHWHYVSPNVQDMHGSLLYQTMQENIFLLRYFKLSILHYSIKILLDLLVLK